MSSYYGVMKNHIILLLTMVALYFAAALTLHAAYGPSYGFWSGEDCWEPDGNGGWVAHGKPQEAPPDQPSELIPIGLLYLPIFLPAGLLVLFMFTPLSRKLERRPPDEPDQPAEDEDTDNKKAAS